LPNRLIAGILLVFVLQDPQAVAQGGTGQIGGIVRDPHGAVRADATIVLQNERTAVSRTAVTTANGLYWFPALDPGRYSLTVRAAGFAPQSLKHVDVTVGLSVRHDFTLNVVLAETVTVSADAPAAPMTSEVGGVVSERQIETLPVNSRQYTSLALILPGTTLDSTRPIGPSVNVGASMTFNSTGYVVDGMINSFAEDGEPRQSVPLDAVEEFKVANVQPDAEFGLATGGTLHVVTRSGTNVHRGGVFEYLRDEALNAQGVFQEEKPDFGRHQFGGSIGGPIVRGRLHFFAAAEWTSVSESYTVSTGLPELYGAVEGTFEKPSHRNLYFGRLNWEIGRTQRLFARYLQDDERSNCIFCGGTSASGVDQVLPRRGLVLGYTWAPGRVLNDVRFQHAKAAYYAFPSGTKAFTQPGSFPAERMDRFTRRLVFPSLTWGVAGDELGEESRWQVKNTFAVNMLRHQVRAGVDFSFMPYVGENSGQIGTYFFGTDQPFNPANPATLDALTGALAFEATFPPATTRHPTAYYVAFLQDDWRIREDLTVNIGLRYERLHGAANEDLDPTIFPVEIPYIDVTARGDRNNLAPRAGVAWNVGGDGRTVVRGGYGMHYGHVRIPGNLEEFRNFQQLRITIRNPAYPDPYGGREPREFAGSQPADISVVANDYVQPYSHQFTAGVSQRLWADTSLHVDFVTTNTNHERKVRNINPENPETGERPDAAFGRVLQSQPTGFIRHRAVYARIEKRFSRRHQALASYTYTRSRDNNPGASYFDSFEPALDEGPSNGERRHAFVASGSVVLPWDIGLGVIWTLRSQLPWMVRPGRDVNRDGMLNDLVPGIERNAGGRTLGLDVVNAWRDTFGLAAIPLGQIDSSRVNVVDVKASKPFQLAAFRLEVIAQAFNVFNVVNLGAQFEGGRVSNALSPSFGRVLTAKPPRQVEIAAKVTW
jgi:hypothetical protein